MSKGKPTTMAFFLFSSYFSSFVLMAEVFFKNVKVFRSWGVIIHSDLRLGLAVSFKLLLVSSRWEMLL